MELYYLENRTPPNGNVAYFWRKGGCGYTAKIDEAELFTSEDADLIIRSAEGSPKFVKHEKSKVHRVSFQAVNIDDL